MKFQQLKELFDLPLFDLIKKSREVHDANWSDNEIQLCTLLSIKTGGCSEDCSYCAQSSRHNSGIQVERLMEKEEILNYDVLTEKEIMKREGLAEYRRELEKIEWPEESEEKEGWSSPGRFWGIKGRKNLPEVVSDVLEITSEKKVFEIMRLMRRYSGVKARNYRSLSILCNSPEQWERVLKL